jgi:hypothetical protein
MKCLTGCRRKKHVVNVITSVALELLLIAKLSVTHISTSRLSTKPMPQRRRQ